MASAQVPDPGRNCHHMARDMGVTISQQGGVKKFRVVIQSVEKVSLPLSFREILHHHGESDT